MSAPENFRGVEMLDVHALAVMVRAEAIAQAREFQGNAFTTVRDGGLLIHQAVAAPSAKSVMRRDNSRSQASSPRPNSSVTQPV